MRFYVKSFVLSVSLLLVLSCVEIVKANAPCAACQTAFDEMMAEKDNIDASREEALTTCTEMSHIHIAVLDCNAAHGGHTEGYDESMAEAQELASKGFDALSAALAAERQGEDGLASGWDMCPNGGGQGPCWASGWWDVLKVCYTEAINQNELAEAWFGDSACQYWFTVDYLVAEEDEEDCDCDYDN